MRRESDQIDFSAVSWNPQLHDPIANNSVSIYVAREQKRKCSPPARLRPKEQTCLFEIEFNFLFISISIKITYVVCSNLGNFAINTA